MPKDIPQFNVKVGEDFDDEDNIIGTALVDDPATQKLFAIFSSDKVENQLDFKITLPTPENEQKVSGENGKFEQIISGVWFMPETDYPRSVDGQLFTTSITREELKKAVSNFVKSGAANNFNIMHDGNPVEGLQTMEIWVLEKHDKRSPILNNSIEDLGYKKENIPLGTVFMTVFVENEKFFNEEILSGNLKGFSIEAFFILQQKFKRNMSKQKEMFAKLGLVQETGILTTEKGALNFSKDGISLGKTPITNGNYKLKTGFSVVIRDGKVADFGFENADDAATATAEAEAVAQAEADQNTADAKATQDAADKVVADQKAADEKAAKEVADKETGKVDVAAAVAKAFAERDAKDLKKKEDKTATEAEAAKKKELDDLKAENEALKKGKVIPDKSLVSQNENYDKGLYKEVTRGGKKKIILR